MRSLLLFTVLLLAGLSPICAQEGGEENPATKPGVVSIVFLPPPMEGTVSLGIFNKAGKLVRTLKREASAEKDFTLGLNGLITQWDGKDDGGAAQKAGSYGARGFMVKGVSVSGEAFRGNDWVDGEEAPRLRTIESLQVLAGDKLGLRAQLSTGKEAALQCGLDGHLRRRDEKGAEREKEAEEEGEKANGLGDILKGNVTIQEGKLAIGGKGPALPELHQPVDYAMGREGTLWIIDRSPERVEVQQYSRGGEFLRRLSIEPGEPVPVKIAASTTSDLIFLLESGPGVQRIRGLGLETLKAPLPSEPTPDDKAERSSTWRIVLSKSIHACGDFATAAPLLGRGEPPKAEAKVSVKLPKNPLGTKSEATSVDVVATCREGGSFLETADGLTLCRLTDTPDLQWAALVKDAKGYSLVQSDGAVVEEYRLGKLTGMMAFDAGDYELKW